ncbi:hypothetical protein pb186bvf_020627 [Paramecium bursaria]
MFSQIIKPDYLYGINPIMAAINVKRREIFELYVADNQNKNVNPRISNIMNKAHQLKIPVQILSKVKLEKFCSKGQPHQNVILKCSKLEYINEINTQNHIVVADAIQDPQNFGALLRVGIDNILVDSSNTCTLTPTVSKTSSGALEMMNIYKAPNLIQSMKELRNKYQVIGTSFGGRSRPLSEFKKLDKKAIIIFGNESNGMHPELKQQCHELIQIPSQQREFPATLVDSLNVSVSAGIVLSHLL